MLAVYTFVFSVIFKARWNPSSTSKTEFALVLFAGLIVFNLFSECITKAPTLILSNTNYVKRVVFPLETLVWVSIGSALFHLMISLAVWLLVYSVFFGLPPPTVLLFPILLLPVILMVAGLSWFIASLGVYIRDMTQLIGILMTIIMFLSPIFYPVTAIPIEYRPYLYLNPLTTAIEQSREILFFGHLINWSTYLEYSIGAFAIAWFGFAWFQKTRKGFADVL